MAKTIVSGSRGTAGAKKSLGQHYLVSSSIVNKIRETCLECAREVRGILEIGPGRGALTAGLMESGKPLWVLELDDRLARRLGERFASLHVLHGDARGLDLKELSQETGLTPWLVVGNLPYNAGTEILKRVLRFPTHAVSVVVMLQREVVNKFRGGGKKGRSSGPLSAWTGAWWKAELLFTVPPGAFQPPPKVISAVCLLRPLREPLLPQGDMDAFQVFLARAFSQPRRALATNLSKDTDERERWREKIRELGAGVLARAGELPTQFLARLFQERGVVGG